MFAISSSKSSRPLSHLLMSSCKYHAEVDREATEYGQQASSSFAPMWPLNRPSNAGAFSDNQQLLWATLILIIFFLFFFVSGPCASLSRPSRWLVGWLVDVFCLDNSWAVDSCAECCRAVVENLQTDSEADIYCNQISFTIRSIFHCSRVQWR